MLAEQHQKLAQELAIKLDGAGTGSPLISVHSYQGRQLLLWQYEYGPLDLSIEVSAAHADFCLEPEASDEGFLYYYATSLEAAMEFVKAVECIRQRATFPGIRLGPAFGFPADVSQAFHGA